jgi:hypothetical protein
LNYICWKSSTARKTSQSELDENNRAAAKKDMTFTPYSDRLRAHITSLNRTVNASAPE